MIYVFDFDGTIVDSMAIWHEIDVSIFDEFHAPHNDALWQELTPLSEWETAVRFHECGVDLPIQEIIDRKNYSMEKRYLTDVPLKPGAKEFLQQLKKKGEKIYVCSGTATWLLEKCMKRLELLDLLDGKYAAHDIGYNKSDPHLYTSLAEKLGVPVSEITFFDDNVGAITAAAKAGVHAIGVYDPISENVLDEIKANAERFIYSFEELLDDPK